MGRENSNLECWQSGKRPGAEATFLAEQKSKVSETSNLLFQTRILIGSSLKLVALNVDQVRDDPGAQLEALVAVHGQQRLCVDVDVLRRFFCVTLELASSEFEKRQVDPGLSVRKILIGRLKKDIYWLILFKKLYHVIMTPYKNFMLVNIYLKLCDLS